MNTFEKIKSGLEEAISFERGALQANTRTLSIAPIDSFTSDDIKAIRASVGMTQSVFAKYMGVSVKTVEAWEAGRNHPDGAACRLLSITKANPSFPIVSGIVAI